MAELAADPGLSDRHATSAVIGGGKPQEATP